MRSSKVRTSSKGAWIKTPAVRELARRYTPVESVRDVMKKGYAKMDAFLHECEEELPDGWLKHRVGVDIGDAFCGVVYVIAARRPACEGWSVSLRVALRDCRVVWPRIGKLVRLELKDGLLGWVGGVSCGSMDVDAAVRNGWRSYTELCTSIDGRVAPGLESIRVTRVSSGAFAYARKASWGTGTTVIRAGSGVALGLAGAQKFLRLVKKKRPGSVVLPNADRLGRSSWQGVRDLLESAGLKVVLEENSGGLDRRVEGDGRRAHENRALKEMFLVNEKWCGRVGIEVAPGVRLLAALPDDCAPLAVLVPGPDRPAVVAAALVAREAPFLCVMIVAAEKAPARIITRTGVVIPCTLASLRKLPGRNGAGFVDVVDRLKVPERSVVGSISERAKANLVWSAASLRERRNEMVPRARAG